MADIQRFTSKCVEQDKAFLSDAFSESFRAVGGSSAATELSPASRLSEMRKVTLVIPGESRQ